MIKTAIKLIITSIFWSMLVFGVDTINEINHNGNPVDILKGNNIGDETDELPFQNNSLTVKLKRGKMRVSLPLMKHFINHSISTMKTVNRIKLKELENKILKTVRDAENNRRPFHRSRHGERQKAQIKSSPEIEIPEEAARNTSSPLEKVKDALNLVSTLSTTHEIVETLQENNTSGFTSSEKTGTHHHISGQYVKVCTQKSDINKYVENGDLEKVNENSVFRTETSSSPPFMSESGKRRLGSQPSPNSFSVPYVYLRRPVNSSPENPYCPILFNIPVLQIRERPLAFNPN